MRERAVSMLGHCRDGGREVGGRAPPRFHALATAWSRPTREVCSLRWASVRPELGRVAALCATAHPLHTEIAERFGASMPEATVRQCGRQCVRDSVPPCLKQRRDRTLGAPSVNPVHGRRRARMRTLPSPRPPRGLSLGAPLADLEALVAAVEGPAAAGPCPPSSSCRGRRSRPSRPRRAPAGRLAEDVASGACLLCICNTVLRIRCCFSVLVLSIVLSRV